MRAVDRLVATLQHSRTIVASMTRPPRAEVLSVLAELRSRDRAWNRAEVMQRIGASDRKRVRDAFLMLEAALIAALGETN